MHSELPCMWLFASLWTTFFFFAGKLIRSLRRRWFPVGAGSGANRQPAISRSARFDADRLIGMLRILIAGLVGDRVLIANIVGYISRDRVDLVKRIGKECRTSGRVGEALKS